uniref:Uncharacterized protein n=1 Tax=Peronospora matthiolae TaxID=2874970 RepID=A0AAV1T5P5_9STRA
MLRAQITRDENVREVDDDAAVSVLALPSKEHEEEDAHDLLLLRQTNDEFLWLLLLAAVSECVTTCYLPGYTLHRFQLNVGGMLLNWIGPYLDGLSYGYEDRMKGTEISLVCTQFRSAFLGVFTSYSFMVDHAGDLSSETVAAGPLYICASLGGGCGCFYLGKLTVVAAWKHPILASVTRVAGAMLNRSSLMTSLVALVGVTTLRAALGPHGFVRDPKDPQFIGSLHVADGEELVLGILMSCSAILLSNYVCGFFPQQPVQLQVATSRNGGPFIDWGCLCCNLLASFLAGFTYQLSRNSPIGVTNNLLALKFVSSFCGSLSVFSAAVSIISRLWLAGNRHSALWNFALQVLLGLICMPYLYKRDAL